MLKREKLLTFFSPPEISEWLKPVDLFISKIILSKVFVGNLEKIFIECGVWKGAYSISLLKNCEQSIGFGVDPYPNHSAEREIFIESLQSENLENSFTLVRSWSDLPQMKANLIHIDGLHTEDAVYRDLVESHKLLSIGGCIIIDDMAHPYFPGIPSAVHRFMLEFDYRMVLSTFQKAYLVHKEFHPKYYSDLFKHLCHAGLIIERHQGDLDKFKIDYLQKPTLMGFDVLLCVSPRNDKLFRVLGLRSTVRKVLLSLVPPLILDGFNRLR